jgi:putative spermidine/putrescine transport system substrate-binding protein
MTPEEVKTVIDFLIERKRAGQFRVIWSSFEQAVDLLTSKEVHVLDGWEPIVFAARDGAFTEDEQR